MKQLQAKLGTRKKRLLSPKELTEIYLKIFVKNLPCKKRHLLLKPPIKILKIPTNCEIQIQAGCAVGPLEVYTELTKLDTWHRWVWCAFVMRDRYIEP